MRQVIFVVLLLFITGTVFAQEEFTSEYGVTLAAPEGAQVMDVGTHLVILNFKQGVETYNLIFNNRIIDLETRELADTVEEGAAYFERRRELTPDTRETILINGENAIYQSGTNASFIVFQMPDDTIAALVGMGIVGELTDSDGVKMIESITLDSPLVFPQETALIPERMPENTMILTTEAGQSQFTYNGERFTIMDAPIPSSPILESVQFDMGLGQNYTLVISDSGSANGLSTSIEELYQDKIEPIVSQNPGWADDLAPQTWTLGDGREALYYAFTPPDVPAAACFTAFHYVFPLNTEERFGEVVAVAPCENSEEIETEIRAIVETFTVVETDSTATPEATAEGS